MSDDVSQEVAFARVTTALGSRPLLSAWGVAIVAVDAGRVTLRMPRLPDPDAGSDAEADPPHGTFDRSVVVALGDAACWLAVAGLTDAGSHVATLEMKVDLVAVREPLVALEAVGAVQRSGRSLSAARATVFGIGPDGSRHEVGLVQATMLAGDRDG